MEFKDVSRTPPKIQVLFQDYANPNLVAFSLFSAVKFFSVCFQLKMLSKTSTCTHLIAKRQQVCDSSAVMIIGSQCLVSKQHFF